MGDNEIETTMRRLSDPFSKLDINNLLEDMQIGDWFMTDAKKDADGTTFFFERPIIKNTAHNVVIFEKLEHQDYWNNLIENGTNFEIEEERAGHARQQAEGM